LCNTGNRFQAGKREILRTIFQESGDIKGAFNFIITHFQSFPYINILSPFDYVTNVGNISHMQYTKNRKAALFMLSNGNASEIREGKGRGVVLATKGAFENKGFTSLRVPNKPGLSKRGNDEN
jgi:hypothetical protein